VRQAPSAARAAKVAAQAHLAAQAATVRRQRQPVWELVWAVHPRVPAQPAVKAATPHRSRLVWALARAFRVRPQAAATRVMPVASAQVSAQQVLGRTARTPATQVRWAQALAY
jgi:hypothetical protein